MTKRYFEFSEGSSNKFWEVWREGPVVNTRYGKIGSDGQTTLKNAGSDAAAEKLWAKLVAEKVKKGYLERGAAKRSPSKPVSTKAKPVSTKAKAPAPPKPKPVPPKAKAPVSPKTKAPVSPKTKAPVSPKEKAPVSPKKSGAPLTREGLRGARICLRGKFDLGAIKDIERALKDLGARTTKFWTDADIIFVGEGGEIQPYYEGYKEARHKQVPQRVLASLIGDLGAVHEARTKKESPVAQKRALDPADAAFRGAFWKKPDDLTALKVWADALSERGDVRGAFIQLCLLENPTDEQSERCHSMRKKLGGQLVGPARQYVRTFDFDQHGLVSWVTTEAPRVVEGFDLIAALNPRLTLSVTSLRTKTMAVIAELRKHPLGQIHTLDLRNNGLSDSACTALAPGLEGLKRLNLSDNDITQQGLEAMAPHLKRLEQLALHCSRAQINAGQAAAVLAGWVNAITTPGLFPSLEVLALSGGYGMPGPTAADRKRLDAKLKVATSLNES